MSADAAKILIVDDDPLILSITRRVLASAGYTVFSAISGALGLQIAEQELPDLLLLDVDMPEIDGFEMCRRVKANPRLSGSFVAMVSGSRMGSDSKVIGLDLGANDYITRPISNQELLARVRAMLRLQQSENLLKEALAQASAAFDAVADAMFLTDSAGAILRCNLAAEQMFSASKDELLGQDCARLVLAQSGLSVSGQAQNFTFLRGQRWLSASLRPVARPAGAPTGLVWVLADITQSRLAERELQEAHASLELRVSERTADLYETNQALEKAVRLKNEFLASLSHELRTPLTAILGFSDVLLYQTYGQLNEKQVSAVSNIQKSGQQLLALINDLLDYSKLETDQLELKEFNLQEACQACLQITVKLAQVKGLQPAGLRFEPDANFLLRADERRVKQMLLSLLSNAIKFTEAGGQYGLDVHLSELKRVVELTVWDTGIGIDLANSERMFEPFIQLDARLARKYGGVGLGLALVKRLAEMHGGCLSVESALGAGSRFTLCLPV